MFIAWRIKYMENKVLLIDDDERLLKLLREYLEGNGFNVFTLGDGSGALKFIERESPDIIILDIMLPGKDGLEILKDINRKHSIPVIMLTAKGEDTDRIIGLELGADDYLSKPFNPRELLARMRAVMRRVVPAGNEESEKADEDSMRVGGVILDRLRHTVTVNNEEMELSLTEYKILEVLMRKPNVVLSRDQIMNYARGKDLMAFDRSIDVHVSKLRAKLEKDHRYPKRIKTIWGSGYMFVDAS
jgi:two-component system, OmpR family, phosphate regulon response regulator OmpR